jgi:hypothetical protein
LRPSRLGRTHKTMHRIVLSPKSPVRPEGPDASKSANLIVSGRRYRKAEIQNSFFAADRGTGCVFAV